MTTTWDLLENAIQALEFARSHKFPAETIRELEERVASLRASLGGFNSPDGDD